MTRATVKSHTRHGLRLHPLPLRIMHWINAVAMIIMIGSGWKIYNDEVIFGWLHFPDWITIGGGAQGALQWHFFAMWILVINGIAYLVYGLVTGRFRRKLLPIWLRELIATIRDALRLQLAHDDLTHYNAVQKLLYVGIIVVGIVQVLSGLVDLEAGAVLGAGGVVLRLPGRAPRAFPRHGRDRAVSRRARGAGAARAEDAGGDDHRRARARRHPAGRAAGRLAPDAA